MEAGNASLGAYATSNPDFTTTLVRDTPTELVYRVAYMHYGGCGDSQYEGMFLMLS